MIFMCVVAVVCVSALECVKFLFGVADLHVDELLVY